MAASRSDQAILSASQNFQDRVRQSLIAACSSIYNEGWATARDHLQRATQAVKIMNSPAVYAPLFAMAVATDANVIADATQAGTVVLTAGNVTAQQALVTDTHIDTAVSSSFNSFLQPL